MKFDSMMVTTKRKSSCRAKGIFFYEASPPTRPSLTETNIGLSSSHQTSAPRHSSPRPDDTCVDKLDNLVPHRRVLHVVLQRLRVALRLLQDALHHGIRHDFLLKKKRKATRQRFASHQGRRTLERERTATSGSLIARSIVSCSVSLARCVL